MEADCRLLVAASLLLALISPSGTVSLEVFVTSDQGSRKLVDPRSGFKAVTNTDLLYTCEVSGMEPAMFVQIVKVRIVVSFHGDRKQIFQPKTWPYIMANRTLLSNVLMETGRYRVTETSSGSLNLLVTSTQPEDSGVWACRIHWRNEVYMNTEVDVVVLGPIQGLHLRPSTIPPKNGTYTSGDLLYSKTGRKESISCSIFISNWSPDVIIFTSDVRGQNPRDVTKNFEVAGFPETSFKQFSIGGRDSPLRIFLGKVTYRTNNVTFNYWDHNRRLYCTAKGDLPYVTEDGFMDLSIQFQPVEARCDPPTVFLPPHAESATLSCSVLSNPKPEVTWRTGGPLPENADISLTGSADRYTSTLTIRGANASNFGVYKMAAKNDLGEMAAYVTLTEGKGSGARRAVLMSERYSAILWVLFTIYRLR